MNLTDIFDYKNKEFKPFRSFMSSSFPLPKFRNVAPIKSAPQTTNPALIGTAFDYVLRFHLEREYKGQVYGRKWAAEKALAYFRENDTVMFTPRDKVLEMDDDTLLRRIAEKKQINRTQYTEVARKLAECRTVYTQFVNRRLKNKNKLTESCLFLGRLDTVTRIGERGKEFVHLLPENKLDIDDLNKIMKNSDLSLFKPQKKIVLNPSFGTSLIKADGDIIVDDVLIDVKTTKHVKLTRKDFNQVLGYYLLYLIDGVYGHADLKIKRLGVYFARYNILWSVEVNGIGNQELFNLARERLEACGRRNR